MTSTTNPKDNNTRDNDAENKYGIAPFDNDDEDKDEIDDNGIICVPTIISSDNIDEDDDDSSWPQQAYEDSFNPNFGYNNEDCHVVCDNNQHSTDIMDISNRANNSITEKINNTPFGQLTSGNIIDSKKKTESQPYKNN